LDVLDQKYPAEDTTDTAKEYSTSLSGLAMAKLVECLAAFKNPAFHEEQEWRLFFNQHYRTGPPPRFRRYGTFILPYHEIAHPRGGSLPLVEVIQGPHNEPEIALNSIRQLLLSRRYPINKLNASNIPLRTK